MVFCKFDGRVSHFRVSKEIVGGGDFHRCWMLLRYTDFLIGKFQDKRTIPCLITKQLYGLLFNFQNGFDDPRVNHLSELKFDTEILGVFISGMKMRCYNNNWDTANGCFPEHMLKERNSSNLLL